MWKRGFTKGSFNKLCSYIDLSLSDHGFLRVFWTSLSKLSITCIDAINLTLTNLKSIKKI